MSITLSSQKLHKKQFELANAIDKSIGKYNLVCCGRNFGKTILLINLLLKQALTKSDKLIYFISQTYSFSNTIYKQIFSILKNTGLIRSANKGESIELTNGTVIEFYSYNNWDNLRGYNFADIIFIDEAAKISNTAWNEVMKYICISNNKLVYLFSTPRGKNWFYDLYTKSLNNYNYQFFKATTYDNPHISDDEKAGLDLAAGTDIWRQEVMAEFIENGGEVFNKVEEAFILPTFAHSKQKKYFIGVDLAKSVDFTVIIVLTELREIAYFKRFNKTDYETINNEISNVIKQFAPYGFIETNNFGGTVLETQHKRGYGKYVQGWTATNETKGEIIRNLILKFQEQKIFLTPHLTELKQELEQFGFKITSQGNITYAAHGSGHDDCVIALALANWAVHNFYDHTGIWSMSI